MGEYQKNLRICEPPHWAGKIWQPLSVSQRDYRGCKCAIDGGNLRRKSRLA
jgi:hypothetical protein